MRLNRKTFQLNKRDWFRKLRMRGLADAAFTGTIQAPSMLRPEYIGCDNEGGVFRMRGGGLARLNGISEPLPDVYYETDHDSDDDWEFDSKVDVDNGSATYYSFAPAKPVAKTKRGKRNPNPLNVTLLEDSPRKKAVAQKRDRDRKGAKKNRDRKDRDRINAAKQEFRDLR